MGLELVVERAVPLSFPSLLERLAALGLAASIVMVDGALAAPGANPPNEWRDVRLRTRAGTVTLARRPGGVAVLVFGNADAALQQAQRAIADALAAG